VLNLFQLRMIKDIVELELAVCVDIKLNPPPDTAVGKAVIADKELLFADTIAIM
jgi:hypothetical protein